MLGKLTSLFGGRSAAISLHSPKENAVRLQMQWNLSDEFQQAMEANMALNPIVPCFHYYNVDQPFSAFEFVGETEMRNSQWSKNTIIPAGYGDAAFTILAKSTLRFGALCIMRDAQAANYDRHDIEKLRLLAPHVRRAVMIADLLDARSIERTMLAKTLDLVHAGVILTKADGKIVHTNSAARALLGDGVLCSMGGELRASDAQSANELRQAIASAGRGTTADIPRAGVSVVAKAMDGRDMAIWVLPLDQGLRYELGASLAASVAVFIRELGNVSPFPADLFVRRYGITPAECRFLVSLTQGLTPADAAASLGISMATARTHIARLLAKTCTQNQADLMRLALSVLAPATTAP